MTETENWPTISKTEKDFKKFLDKNSETLDPIEGIWIMKEGGAWRNVLSGLIGVLSEHNPYRIAIVRDKDFMDFANYDFVAVTYSRYSFLLYHGKWWG